MEVLFTTDTLWLNKWDDFVSNNSRGSHLLLTDWIQSYKSYGFKYEVCICTKDNEIIGGYAAVIAKVLNFRFYIIPHGPIFKQGFEANLNDCLKELKLRANTLKCCYVQFSLPISNNVKIAEHVYNSSQLNLKNINFNKGKLFNYVYCSYGINWVDFGNYKTPEDFLNSLTPKVRRNIRMPYNKGASSDFSKLKEEIKAGYLVIEDNASRANYSVRSFNDFSDTIESLVKRDRAYFITLNHDDTIKATIFAIKAGNYITNINGGTLRSKPDIKLGYMLQWELIKESFKLGYKGYNISMGGSEGVLDFKSKFNTELINFEEPHYHLVLRPFVFNFFLKVEKYIKPYKTKISKILSKFK